MAYSPHRTELLRHELLGKKSEKSSLEYEIWYSTNILVNIDYSI